MTKPTLMDCESFLDTLVNEMYFDEMIDTMHWSRDFDSYKLWLVAIAESVDRKIALSGCEDFDYDTYFYDLYKCGEWGLS